MPPGLGATTGHRHRDLELIRSRMGNKRHKSRLPLENRPRGCTSKPRPKIEYSYGYTIDLKDFYAINVK